MNTQGDYQTKATLETFGFIPKLSAEDVQKQKLNVLSWIPKIEGILDNKEFEFIIAAKSDSV